MPFPIEFKAPGILFRRFISEPILSGLILIDSLIPVGRGQRELIIGDRQSGKTTIATDFILNQTFQNSQYDLTIGGEIKKIYCIYVSIGQKQSTLVSLAKKMIKYICETFSTIISSTAAETSTLQYIAPYSGVALGEWFRDNSMHSLVIYDDITKQAVAYRQMSLLLRRPPGREAFPGDVFYIHSKLLERAAKLSENFGNGSITALPIVETQAGNIAAYIPTNVISITDGQIFLESEIFYKGVRPAISVGLSVSRVGSSAQSKIVKILSGSIKLQLTQFREVEVLADYDTDSIDPTTLLAISKGVRIVELIKQKPNIPLPFFLEVIFLYLIYKGYLNNIPLKFVSVFKEKIIFELLKYNKLENIELENNFFEDIVLDITVLLNLFEENIVDLSFVINELDIFSEFLFNSFSNSLIE